MSRLILPKEQASELFHPFLKAFAGRTTILASKLAISRRTLNSWMAGEYSIDWQRLSALARSQKIAVKLPTGANFFPNYWHTAAAGRNGGLKNIRMYGNPGTSEGRKKGGMKAIENMRGKTTNFKFAKDILCPDHSSKLAEFFGILLGDGGITDYQVIITLDYKTEGPYAKHVCDMGNSLFGLEPSVAKRESVIKIVFSSKKLVGFLIENGLKSGNKIKHQVDVPAWIKRDPRLLASCIRGLVDTDGSFYVDIHRYKNTRYRSPGLCFTSHSLPLSKSVFLALRNMGFRPTKKSSRNIFLRRKEDIFRYFKEIGTSSPKFERKLKSFLEGWPSPA